MTVEPPEGRPLTLRDLLAEASPEVLAPALRRFRRRTVIRGAWVAGLALAALLVTPLLRDDPATLPERYYGSGAIVSVGESVSGGGVTLTVIDGAKLDRTTGALHLIASGLPGDELTIVSVDGVRPTGASRVDLYESGASGSVAEAFAVVPIGTNEIAVSVAVLSSTPDRQGTVEITIDLTRSQNLQLLWR